MSSVASAVIGTVVSTAGGMYAANEAADAQKSASEDATNAQLKMYKQSRKDNAPWRNAGANALKKLQKKVYAGPGNYKKSPGYEFRLSEGNRAIERSAAARGGLLSGRAAKAIDRFSQNYATQDYDNFLTRYYQSLTPFQSLAGVGQTAAQQDASNAMVTGNALAQNYTNAGQATASGYINQANALTGGINSGINNYLTWKYVNGNTPAATPTPAAAVPNAIWT